MIPETKNWWKEQPLKTVLYGAIFITIASLLKLAADWISIPLPISSIRDLYNAVGYSFSYVLNFDLKLWWVFLLVIYFMMKFNRNDD